MSALHDAHTVIRGNTTVFAVGAHPAIELRARSFPIARSQLFCHRGATEIPFAGIENEILVSSALEDAHVRTAAAIKCLTRSDQVLLEALVALLSRRSIPTLDVVRVSLADCPDATDILVCDVTRTLVLCRKRASEHQ